VTSERNKLWILSDLDRGVDHIGQFVPEDVTHETGARIEASGSLNQEFPIVQWLSGELEKITFKARLFATDSTDLTIEDRYYAIQNLTRRASDLKRIPICYFSWGALATLQVQCLVQSVAPAVFDEIRNDGTARGVSLQITLIRYEEPEWTATDPSVPEKFTRVRAAKRGDTYESIARSEYGNAELGVLLRQLNPRTAGMALADLRKGDLVHIYPEEYLYTIPIEPEFHGFKSGPGNEAAQENLRRIFDLRARDRFSVTFPDGTEKF